MRRKRVPKAIENQVLTASRRQCCLCVFLENRKGPVDGQIAHLDRDNQNPKFENLAWLCFQHHHQYDSRSRQAKGFQSGEVQHWRDQLYLSFDKIAAIRDEAIFSSPAEQSHSSVSGYDKVIAADGNRLRYLNDSWRFPLWLNANELSHFAYKASNGMDGICLIERVNLPDGRVVVACIQGIGNPGQSITNAVEELALQVCERFDIPADRLVWLEHYEGVDENEWRLVTFGSKPPHGHFADPAWTVMNQAKWASIKLQPKKRLKVLNGNYQSKLLKMFHWPDEAI